MSAIMILLAGLCTAFATMAILRFAGRNQLRVSERLQMEVSKGSGIQYLPPQLEESLVHRLKSVLRSNLSGLLRKLIPNNRRESYRYRLQRAGHPLNMDVDSFLIGKYAVLLVLLLLGLASRSIWVFAICLLGGLFLPDLYLKGQENRRRDQILRSFPDILDLLTVSVQAGLGFDAALQRVAEKSKGPLVEEFEKTMTEISMGKPRRQALRDMADRMDVNDVTTFLSAIIQADQLGISISNILRVQSHQVREIRRMKTEEQAQKAPIKMLIPLVCFIFPVILVVLLGPAILQIVDTL